MGDATWGRALELLRKNAGWSQVAVAVVLEVNPATVSRIEHGQAEITLEQLERLGWAWGYPTTAELVLALDRARQRT